VAALPLAFDTGPGNVLIDWAAQFVSGGRLAYDRDGELAVQGKVQSDLLERWLAHPYYTHRPPKTTGRELFTAGLAQQMWEEASGLPAEDVVATITALTAASIVDAYVRFAPGPLAEVVVSGGGFHNPVLMAELRSRLAVGLGREVAVIPHAALGIEGDAKEALAFALLAYLCVHGVPGNVPACTGALHPALLGKVALGRTGRGVVR
jgi:anhydro-N-acetylmuramic acid kinase